MKKRFSSLMRSLTLGGLIATAVARALIIFTASPVPDPASGRTEPELFAPLISSSFDYITPARSWLLIVLTGATVISFVAWMVFALLERGSGLDDGGSGRSRAAGRHGR
ncbi:hypothetical protein [Mesorhizobium atlanticum]|uniref:Uncharacterized protein n=1 Tax=Mesorhizobium atlanticum TaxID=2233532 RepID=A0A330GVF2_9HYPH|nr:hypothetical protein [Mesorhizobium atlanticum]RAZ78517.1 hypothetical protein DPM35_08125 [Mesorhizobium atlanticum]